MTATPNPPGRAPEGDLLARVLVGAGCGTVVITLLLILGSCLNRAVS